MRMTILCPDLQSPHTGWQAIDELAYLLAYYFDAELLSPNKQPGSWLRSIAGFRRDRHAPLATSGGDVLMVVAHGPNDLAMIEAIPQVRKKYTKIHGFITDSYFHLAYRRATAHYDSIAVTAHEDVKYPAERFGIAVSQLYQGVDALRWAPPLQYPRDIDIIGYGRTPRSYHNAFADHFHDAACQPLYLHSPLGHVTGNEVRRERAMLFKLLHRTRVSLAFHLYVEPEGNRPRSMMVTSRWLESLLAGCIVAGKRPVSRMADEMLFWNDATVELTDEPAQAVQELMHILEHNDDLQDQRRSNTRHVIEHHDWRYRIEAMCKQFRWPVPPALTQDIQRLHALAKAFE